MPCGAMTDEEKLEDYKKRIQEAIQRFEVSDDPFSANERALGDMLYFLEWRRLRPPSVPAGSTLDGDYWQFRVAEGEWYFALARAMLAVLAGNKSPSFIQDLALVKEQ